MSNSDELPAGPRPGDRHTVFTDDPVSEHLLRGLITVSMELSVTRERLASMEALLAEAGLLDRAKLDGFTPPPEDAAAREAERRKLVEAILAPLVESLSKRD